MHCQDDVHGKLHVLLLLCTLCRLRCLTTRATAADVMREQPAAPDGASPEEVVRQVHLRVLRIAERATWDRVTQELTQLLAAGGSQAPLLLASLLSQLATDTAEVTCPCFLTVSWEFRSPALAAQSCKQTMQARVFGLREASFSSTSTG